MRMYQPVEGADRLPQAMVEAATEFDWIDLPDYLQDTLRNAAEELRRWADMQDEPLLGEVVDDESAALRVEASIKELREDSLRRTRG
jgi:hypothetical protein